jgi:type II secretory pathway component GspD/PulD (secretin)
MFWSPLLFTLAVLLGARAVCGEDNEVKVNGQAGSIVVDSNGAVTPGNPNPGMPTGPMPPGAVPAGMPPGMNVKPGALPGKPADGAKHEEGPKPFQRPTKPPMPPRPDELMVRPDKDGKVRFNFSGQPWPKVLEWLAQISGMSLDYWPELPGDYLNLTTRRSYTVREARDLINRHLLMRGYTLLSQGEMLTAANIKKLDPSLVPRVAPGELGRRDPYEFVKVSFPLDSLTANETVQELAPMKSPNGTLTPLPETNRLEAMDAVINLREIFALLKEEQSDDSQHRLIRTFTLYHARAADVRQQLQDLLGLESKAGAPAQTGQMAVQPGQMNPEQMAQMAQMSQMSRRQQGQSGQPGGEASAQPAATTATPKPAALVSLVVNERMNSILAHAPPDKMAIIAQAIAAIDVPSNRGRSLVANMNQWQRYPLVGVDSELVVKTLKEIGDLDPATRLVVDPKNKVIIAYASPLDQMTIHSIVNRLSGSERELQVRNLRRLSADEVAGTIAFMMGGPPKKQKERQMPWYYGGYQSSQPSTEPTDEFRVDADVEHNRLFVRANAIEMAEVDKLLVKLGELPAKGGSAETRREIDTGDAQETEELLERIRRDWPSLAPNPLVLPPTAPKEKKEVEPPRHKRIPAEEPVSPPSRTTMRQPGGPIFRFADLRREAADDQGVNEPAEGAGQPTPPANQSPGTPPPVEIRIGPDGRLIISSEDTKALDLLEEMIAQSASRHKEYEIFHLKYAFPYTVAATLEDFFEQGEKKPKARMPYWMRWEFPDDEDDKSQDVARLSKRRKVKFIPDLDTNSIMVVGADSSQLKTVKDLIAVYDQPQPNDSQTRKTEIIPLRYAKASEVEKIVKDVYRDLLSANDKALLNTGPGRGQPDRHYVVYEEAGETEDKHETHKGPKFQGLLSIGVDEASNVLAVSAPVYLFDPVSKLIKQLDESAAPNNAVRVVKVGPGISADRLRGVLESVINKNSSHGASAAKRPSRQTGPQPTDKAGTRPAETNSSNGG